MENLYCRSCKSESVASIPILDEDGKLLCPKVDCFCLECGYKFRVKVSNKIAGKWAQMKKSHPKAEVIIEQLP